MTVVSAESTATDDDFVLGAQSDGSVYSNAKSFTKTGTGSVTFTIGILPDGDGSETLKLKAKCGSNEDTIEFTIASATGANGDPHFIQKIFNHFTNKTDTICYDVAGQKDNFIKIFTDSKYKTQLFGQLKDDYYMHNIIFKISHNMLTASIDYIIFPSNSKIYWDDPIESDWIASENFIFKLKKNFMLLKSNKNDELTYGILRKKDNFKKYFMDIVIYGLSTKYDGRDGLIGNIGNKRISILPAIQSNEIEQITTIIINGLRLKGFYKKRKGEPCISLNIKDLISPLKLNEFLLDHSSLKEAFF